MMVTKQSFGKIAIGAFISIIFLFLVMNERKVILTTEIKEKKMLANIVTTFDHVSTEPER